MEAQPGGGAIRVSARKNGDSVTVDVNDAGPGVQLARLVAD